MSPTTTPSTLEKSANQNVRSAPTLSTLPQSQSPIYSYIDEPLPIAPPVEKISKILGLGSDGTFYLKDNFILPWVKQSYKAFPKPLSIIQLQDYSFLGVTSDGLLYQNLDLVNGIEWVPIVVSISDTMKIKSITQLNDGSLIGIDFNDLTMLYKKKNITDVNWIPIGKRNITLIRIIHLTNGTFLALNNNGGLYTKKTLQDSAWVNKTPDTMPAPWELKPHMNVQITATFSEPVRDYWYQWTNNYFYSIAQIKPNIIMGLQYQQYFTFNWVYHAYVAYWPDMFTPKYSLHLKNNLDSPWVKDTSEPIKDMKDIVSILV